MAPHSDKLKMMRVVVREDFSRSRCEALIKDLTLVMKSLADTDAAALRQHEAMSQKAAQDKQPEHHAKVREHYEGEEHSLQGKHGKSHPIC